MVFRICGRFFVGMFVYISVMSNDAKLVLSVMAISCRYIIRWIVFSTLNMFGNCISFFIRSDMNVARW
jgi:hypothetical protein